MAQIAVKVLRKKQEAQDIASFELARPDGSALPPFSAGSHIDVQVPGGLTRQYSLCNDAAEQHRYRIAVLREEGATMKRTFQDESLMARVEGVLDQAGYQTDLTEDEEHGLWEVKTTTIAGNAIAIDYNFASYVEFHKALELYTTLEDRLAAPFTVGENGTKEEVATREEPDK